MSTLRHLPLALPLCFALLAPDPASGEDAAPPSHQVCGGTEDPAGSPSPAVSAADKSELYAGNTDFALDLYQRLRARRGNLFYSPFSISEALAMSWAGARGDTATRMAGALRFTLPQDRLHPAFQSLAHDLARAGSPSPSGGDFHLDIANALWGQRGYSFQAPFLDTLAQRYGACMHLADFEKEPEQAADLINGWVKESTHGKIPEIVNRDFITTKTRLVLTNAVYFNQAWKHRFKPEKTLPATFTRSDGSTVEVPTMSQTQTLRHASGAGWAALELPYDGEALSMVAILPDAGSLGSFERSLTRERLEAILSRLSLEEISLSLPRFEIDTSLKLADELTQLGMGVAFSAAADFSGIDARRPLTINAVVHNARVSVTEAGTEAAAATAVGMVPYSLRVTPVIHFDHPFLFLVRDRVSGTILFVGRVEDPSVR